MKNNFKHLFLVTVTLLILGLGTVFTTKYSYAADGDVSFGSNRYQVTEGDVFNVGVYVRSDAIINDYHVEVHYDSSKVRYISGADSVDTANGILYFEGTNNQTNFRFWLTFEAVATGDFNFYADNTTINTLLEDGTSEAISVKSQGRSPITVGERVETPEEIEEPSEVEVDAVEAIAPEDEGNTEDTELAKEPEVSDEELEEEVKEPEIEALGEKTDDVKPLETETIEPSENSEADTEAPNESVDVEEALFSIFGVSGTMLYVILGVLTFGIIFCLTGVILLISDIKKERKARAAEIKRKEDALKTVIVSFDDSFDEELSDEEDEFVPELEEAGPPVVISVENVSMKFDIATSNTSGIKDYIIQKVKKQVNTKEFYALKDISFDVLKGEVVGIIGTNGSGKSTILKIISGAMTPTSGKVEVDHRKIQILTLGTGFDVELTARENVYLNGSIIGYTKEFIDAHYQDIVEFAELEGFMEEKVKNFSSGMVSRLGFAIATVADAAEILILDEVLAVGDEFFRKKSLARIKELIHGGSTVLIVSHSMPTIVENCTKAVWIEKGQLKMVDDPKKVSEEYRKLEG